MPEIELESPEGRAAEPPVLALTPEQIRATPEFRALTQANRTLARQKGDAETALAAQRQAAEEVRQAAEAERQAALERQLSATLGPAGVAVYAEIAELSVNDPMAAALRVAELVKAAQGQTQPTPVQATAAVPGEGAIVTANASNANATPPPPSQGLEGNAPLGQASNGEDLNQIIAGLSSEYAAVVERNQALSTRNRVTMAERAKGMISYLGAAYLKAGARPKT